MYTLKVVPGKTYLLRIINVGVNAELFFKIGLSGRTDLIQVHSTHCFERDILRHIVYGSMEYVSLLSSRVIIILYFDLSGCQSNSFSPCIRDLREILACLGSLAPLWVCNDHIRRRKFKLLSHSVRRGN